MPITIEMVARAIEPEAWEEYDKTPAQKNGKRSMANCDVWAIERSIEQAERVGKMLEKEGVKNV